MNYYSKLELAQKLKVSCRTVDNWMSVGKISFTKLGRKVIFSDKDINQLIEGNRREAFYHLDETAENNFFPSVQSSNKTINI